MEHAPNNIDPKSEALKPEIGEQPPVVDDEEDDISFQELMKPIEETAAKMRETAAVVGVDFVEKYSEMLKTQLDGLRNFFNRISDEEEIVDRRR